MNELLHTMSADMGIYRFSGETEDSFAYRILYSALGQWCLRIAKNIAIDTYGSTKHNQTIVLNDLLDKYVKIFPSIADKFIDTSKQQASFPVFMRRVYEETGYLLTDEANRNRVANYGRSIFLGSEALFFGIPNGDYSVSGLGILAKPTSYEVSAKDFLIRDNLTCEEYFKACFDPIDFQKREIEQGNLEFFNPLSRNTPSGSWEKKPQTDCTLARESEYGPFYKIMQIAGEMQFSDEPIEPQGDSFSSYEYRRLYFALKAHFGVPLRATITRLDEKYSAIRIAGYLPNREYYYLLLLSWPIHGAFDRVCFLACNDLIAEIAGVLENIGIKVEGGCVGNDKFKQRSGVLSGNS